MRVLVTGASGFIGQHTVAALEARGHEAVPFDQPFDVRDPGDLKVFGASEAVINLAGVLGTPELLGREARAAQVNILGAISVYGWAAGLGIPVVQIGTGHKGQPNPYAITKACAEDLGLARAQWLGEKIAVVRAYHVYGPGQVPGPPHGPAGVHKFFPTFACQALTRGGTIRLHGGGRQVIDPVHVSDVAECLADALDGPYGEVTEAGCGKAVTVREVAEDILAAAMVNCPVLLQDVSGRPGEPEGAEVVAADPACRNAWPYLVAETVGWYREWLARHDPVS